MEKQKSIFKTFKFRCSQLGYIMTCLPDKFTEDDAKEIQSLEYERATGINKNGNKTRGWTDAKQYEVDKLNRKKENKDELPEGCISHLEDLFRSHFWGRRRLVYNKYLEKGIMVEEDALDLLSKIDGSYYPKNEQQFENKYIQGCPDNIELELDLGKDTKANYDMDTFDKAELTPLYNWQLKGYGFLTGIKNWDLCYCLVNTPYHRLQAERKSLFYAMGMPDEMEPRWIEAVCQLERNMIFDMEAFKKEFPGADLMHGTTFEMPTGVRTLEWNSDVPAKMRDKRFRVEFTKQDERDIKRRVNMCREWLCNKEKEVLEKLNS